MVGVVLVVLLRACLVPEVGSVVLPRGSEVSGVVAGGAELGPAYFGSGVTEAGAC